MKRFACIVYTLMLLTLVSCNRKFNKAEWDQPSDDGFPPECRTLMVNDLVSNYKLTGLKYRELTTLLGQPDEINPNMVLYDIELDYGWDIDPVYSKNLEFTFSKDSIITSYKIKEWKH